MKSSELVPGEQYMVDPAQPGSRFYQFPTYKKPVTLIEAPVHGQVMSDWGRSYKSENRNFALVRDHEDREYTVSLAHIRMTWADYEVAREEAKKRRAEKEEREKTFREIASDQQARFRKLGFDVMINGLSNLRLSMYGKDEIEDMLQRLEGK